MGVFRSLKTVIRNPGRCRQPLLPASATPHPSPPLLSTSPLISSRSRFISPLSQRMIPFHGPLFFSSPPWKLSQSATPLYLQCDALLLQNAEFFGLKSCRTRPDFQSSTSTPPSPNATERKKSFPDDNANVGGGEFASNFVNLPNMISMARMGSGPLIAWMITKEWYLSAFWGLGISGATDWLDGYMSRKMRIKSVLGSYLDPLADKILIGCVSLAMVHQSLLHSGLVGLVVVRDAVLVCAAFYKRGSNLAWQWKSWSDYFNLDGPNPEKVEPLLISKVNTVLQLVLVAAALLEPNFRTQETQSYITYLSWVVASTTLASSAAYGMQQMKGKPMSATRVF